MKAISKGKWIGSIILATILLILAVAGGQWGTTFAADDNVSAKPFITSINPNMVKVGSSYKIIIISGGNFGDASDTRVRLKGTVIDNMLTPMQVLPDGISVIINATYFTAPNVYAISVVKSNKSTVPTIPIVPIYDEESDPKPFTVFEPSSVFIPIISK